MHTYHRPCRARRSTKINIFAQKVHGIGADGRLSFAARCLVDALLYWALADDCCTMSNAALAQYLKTSPSTVERALLELEEYGYIRREDVPKTSANATGRVVHLLWVSDPDCVSEEMLPKRGQPARATKAEDRPRPSKKAREVPSPATGPVVRGPVAGDGTVPSPATGPAPSPVTHNVEEIQESEKISPPPQGGDEQPNDGTDQGAPAEAAIAEKIERTWGLIAPAVSRRTLKDAVAMAAICKLYDAETIEEAAAVVVGYHEKDRLTTGPVRCLETMVQKIKAENGTHGRPKPKPTYLEAIVESSKRRMEAEAKAAAQAANFRSGLSRSFASPCWTRPVRRPGPASPRSFFA